MKRSHRLQNVLATLVAIWLAASVSAQTGTVAFTLNLFEENPGQGFKNFYGGGDGSHYFSIGYKFHAAETLLVTDLGILDWEQLAIASSMSGTVPGLDVALYTTNGSLITSATVTTNDTFTSYAGIDARNASAFTNSVFRYHHLSSPVNIPAGDYIIISETEYSPNIPKSFGAWGFTYPGYLTPGLASLTYLQDWTREGLNASFSSSAFFTPPDNTGPTFYGTFGPNLLVIPEPTSVALMGAVLAGIVIRRRRA